MADYNEMSQRLMDVARQKAWLVRKVTIQNFKRFVSDGEVHKYVFDGNGLITIEVSYTKVKEKYFPFRDNDMSKAINYLEGLTYDPSGE